MTRKPYKTRAIAAAIFIIATSGILSPPMYPKQMWKAIDNSEEHQHALFGVHEEERKFCRRWGARFLKYGHVHDKKRMGPSPEMPDDEARLAAMYLKTGYWVPVQGRNSQHTRFVHRYYPSVKRACFMCTELRAIKEKYNMSSKKLLRHMRRADPNLLRRKIHIKYYFDKHELARRQQRAKSLYERCLREPDWLDRCYFIDECSIWIDNTATRGLKVYMDAHDKGYHQVIHYENLHKNKKIKVRMIAAVNAKFGKVYLEFTTGTTKIKRTLNTVAITGNHGPYRKLSNNGLAKGTTREEFEDNMKNIADIAKQQWHGTGKKPLFMWDNASIQVGNDYVKMGFTHDQHVHIPPRSPDFNKPIEHAWNQLKDALLARIYGEAKVITAELVQDWIREIWDDTIQPELSRKYGDILQDSVAKDVHSLPETFFAVKTAKDVEATMPNGTNVVGSGGDYNKAKFR